MKKIVVIIMIISMLSTGCVKKLIEKPSPGYISENTYINEYLGFQYKIPDEWNFVENDDVKIHLDNAIEQGALDEVKDDLDTDYLKEEQLIFLQAYRFPLDVIGKTNPNFLVVADNLRLNFAIKDVNEYIDILEEQLMAMGLYSSFKRLPDIEVDGEILSCCKTTGDLSGVLIEQYYYLIIIKRYAVCFIASTYNYDLEEDVNDTNNIINTLKFD